MSQVLVWLISQGLKRYLPPTKRQQHASKLPNCSSTFRNARRVFTPLAGKNVLRQCPAVETILQR